MSEFDNLFEVIGNIQDHIVENAMYYGGGAVFVFPIIFFTRKYSVPMIQYVLETAIYLVIMHTLVSMLTNFFAWLHNETSMEAVRSRRAGVFWDTPWVYFWDTEAYNPGWIVYMECAFAVIIILLVIRYRPMKIQKARKPTEAAKKGEFNPDQFSSRGRAHQLGQKYSDPKNIGKSGKGRRKS